MWSSTDKEETGLRRAKPNRETTVPEQNILRDSTVSSKCRRLVAGNGTPKREKLLRNNGKLGCRWSNVGSNDLRRAMPNGKKIDVRRANCLRKVLGPMCAWPKAGS